MIASEDFERRIVRALAAARERVRARLVATLPSDATVAATDAGVAIAAVALSRRALTDARLRDIAGLAR